MSGEGAPLRYLSAEAIVDLFAEVQRLAREDADVRLEAGRNYLLPIEELGELCDAAEGRDLNAAAELYLRSLFVMDLFPDGNLRLALLATELFLEENGHAFVYSVDEARRFAERARALRDELYPRRERGNTDRFDEPPNALHDAVGGFVHAHVRPRR